MPAASASVIAATRQMTPVRIGRTGGRSSRISTSAPAATRLAGSAYPSAPNTNWVAWVKPLPSVPPAQWKYMTPARKIPIAISASARMSTWCGSSSGPRASTPSDGRLANGERVARLGGDLRLAAVPRLAAGFLRRLAVAGMLSEDLASTRCARILPART